MSYLGADGIATARKTVAPIDLYVDGDAGDDGNDGSQGSPLATITEAENRIPELVDHAVKIWVQPAAARYNLPTVKSRILRQFVYLLGAQDSSTFHFNVLVATSAAQTGSGNNAVVHAGGLGTNTYRGKVLEVLTGASAGARRIILEHDDTTIVPVTRLPDGVSSGDDFRVVEPSVKIDLPDVISKSSGGKFGTRSDGGLPENPQPGVAIINFDVSMTTERTALGGSVYLYGIDYNSGGLADEWSTFEEGVLWVGNDAIEDGGTANPGALIGTTFGATDGYRWLGWGLGANTQNVFPFFKAAKAQMVGYVVDRLPIDSGRVDVQGFNCWNGGARAFSGYLGLTNLWSYPMFPEPRSKITGALGWGVLGGIDTEVVVTGGVDVAASAGNAAETHGGVIRLHNSVSITDCSVGMYAAERGVVYYNDGLTVTSTAADARAVDAVGGDVDGTVGVAPLDVNGGYVVGGDGSLVIRRL